MDLKAKLSEENNRNDEIENYISFCKKYNTNKKIGEAIDELELLFQENEYDDNWDDAAFKLTNVHYLSIKHNPLSSKTIEIKSSPRLNLKFLIIYENTITKYLELEKEIIRISSNEEKLINESKKFFGSQKAKAELEILQPNKIKQIELSNKIRDYINEMNILADSVESKMEKLVEENSVYKFMKPNGELDEEKLGENFSKTTVPYLRSILNKYEKKFDEINTNANNV